MTKQRDFTNIFCFLLGLVWTLDSRVLEKEACYWKLKMSNETKWQNKISHLSSSVLEGPPRWDVVLVSGRPMTLAFPQRPSTRVLMTAYCYGKKQRLSRPELGWLLRFIQSIKSSAAASSFHLLTGRSQVDPVTHEAKLPSITLPSQAVWDHMDWFAPLR